MDSAPPPVRGTTRWIFTGIVIVVVAIMIMMVVGIARVLWYGEMGDPSRQGRILLFSQEPGRFLMEFGYALVLGWALWALTRRMVRIWRRRKDTERLAYQEELRKLDQGSRTGNLIAKIMLVPFVLIGLWLAWFLLRFLFEVLSGK